jgi:nicotinamidase-related amidase
VTDYTEPHWDRSALVVIDLQRDFLEGGPAAIPETTAIVAKVATLAAAYRRAGRPIIHVIPSLPPRQL